MLKYFIVFSSFFFILNIFKQNTILIGIQGNESVILCVSFLEIIFIVLQTICVSIFIFISMLSIKKIFTASNNLIEPDNKKFESLVKVFMSILTIGILIMTFTVYFNLHEIEQFGKQISKITSTSNTIKLVRSEFQWEKWLRMEWILFVTIATVLFGTGLYYKIKFNILKATSVSIIIYLCLLSPYLKEIFNK